MGTRGSQFSVRHWFHSVPFDPGCPPRENNRPGDPRLYLLLCFRSETKWEGSELKRISTEFLHGHPA